MLIGRAMNRAYFGDSHWSALKNLWMSESGWNNYAKNPRSTATGIAQFLNSTWGSVGCVKTYNAKEQIRCGLKYIKSRYGTPTGAWNYFRSVGHY